MEESILLSTSKKIGLLEPYPDFAESLIDHINSAFFVLWQAGVGPEKGFFIEDDKKVWTDFMPAGPELNGVKTYIFQKTQLIFDPPQSSVLLEALKQSIAEFEWRLNIVDDPGEEEIQNG